MKGGGEVTGERWRGSNWHKGAKGAGGVSQN